MVFRWGGTPLAVIEGTFTQSCLRSLRPPTGAQCAYRARPRGAGATANLFRRFPQKPGKESD